eukprot:TRINITY_DN123363_c0_g1_i1.p1 TRINITY_DN123363_c0_g1~~TRINITY_DN123363_c0_g1_i1.p1  ORF type:complete len:540 (-),score=101.60 TRINITY_DN123363_c0_g1_i1:373-1992(-)
MPHRRQLCARWLLCILIGAGRRSCVAGTSSSCSSDSGTCSAPSPGDDWKAGDLVDAFFRLESAVSWTGHWDQEGKDSLSILRAMPVLPGYQHRTDAAPVGWSERWMPARVVGVSAGNVSVRWEHEDWVDWGNRWAFRRGQGMVHTVKAEQVRARAAPGLEKVALVVVRWGDPASGTVWNRNQEPGGNTISEDFIAEALSVIPDAVGWNYSVLTAWVSNTNQLSKLSEHLLLGPLQGKAEHVLAAYFLWSKFGTTLGYQVPGYMQWDDYFDFHKRVERVGVRTLWPHPTHYLDILNGKKWLAQLGGRDNVYSIPETVTVPMSEAISKPKLAAARAMRLLGRDGEDVKDVHTVAKLGYAYEALAVVAANSSTALAQGLKDLAYDNPHHDVVYVQRRVPNVVVEARVYMVRGQVQHIIWTRFEKEVAAAAHTDYNFFRTLSEWPYEEVYSKIFKKDKAALAAAQGQIARLAQTWTDWMRHASGMPVVSTRLDFLLTHEGPGKAGVYTIEAGEQGYSFGHWLAGQKLVMAENLKVLLSDDVDV